MGAAARAGMVFVEAVTGGGTYARLWAHWTADRGERSVRPRDGGRQQDRPE